MKVDKEIYEKYYIRFKRFYTSFEYGMVLFSRDGYPKYLDGITLIVDGKDFHLFDTYIRCEFYDEICNLGPEVFHEFLTKFYDEWRIMVAETPLPLLISNAIEHDQENSTNLNPELNIQ